jgi:hypothetical protein
MKGLRRWLGAAQAKKAAGQVVPLRKAAISIALHQMDEVEFKDSIRKNLLGLAAP